MKYNITIAALSVVGAALLVGCDTAPPAPESSGAQKASVAAAASAAEPSDNGVLKPVAPPTAPPPVPREPSPNEKALASALGTFERGEYSLAIRQLTPLTVDNALGLTDRLVALKALAFSQCLTKALTSCRRTFEQAFRLDEKFELALAEQGHPVWGPQYERARKSVLLK